MHPRVLKLNERNVVEWNYSHKGEKSIFLESGTSMPVVIHVPLYNGSSNLEMTAEAINIDFQDWVFSCTPHKHSKKLWYNIQLNFTFLQF